MTIGQTRSAFTGLVLFGLACLSAPGLAGAHGALELDDVPPGFVKASITEHSDMEGLNAMILSAPRPGIMLRYNGEQPITVLGMHGEAFLLFSRTGVSVNTNSPSWEALNDGAMPVARPSTASDNNDEPSWVTLSESGSFSWLDPRLNTMKDPQHGDDTSKDWSIPLIRADGKADQIGGMLTYQVYQ